MTSFRRTRGHLAGLALLGALACGETDDGAGPAFPSRDWSGTYSLRVVDSSTDCLGAEAPPPLGDLTLEIRQTIDNDVTVMIGPLVALGGRLNGDELEARGEIWQPISLPDSLVSRTSEVDSLETIVYRLEVALSGDSLRGRYEIRAPDLIALARDAGERRCAQEYEVRGGELTGALSPERRQAGGASGGPR